QAVQTDHRVLALPERSLVKLVCLRSGVLLPVEKIVHGAKLTHVVAGSAGILPANEREVRKRSSWVAKTSRPAARLQAGCGAPRGCVGVAARRSASVYSE